MAPRPEFPTIAIALKLEGGRHIEVCDRPVAHNTVQVSSTALQEYGDVPLLLHADCRSVSAAAQWHEAATVADHSTEQVRMMPSDGKRCDSARTKADDCSP